MKTCRLCKVEKVETDFYAHPDTKDRLSSHCKKCNIKASAESLSRNPLRKQGGFLRRYWKGVSWQVALQKYNELLEKQGGVCAICGNSEKVSFNGKTIRLAVDHCHTTGKIRGILCRDCNIAEGLLKTPEIVDKLSAYMKATR